MMYPGGVVFFFFRSLSSHRFRIMPPLYASFVRHDRCLVEYRHSPLGLPAGDNLGCPVRRSARRPAHTPASCRPQTAIPSLTQKSPYCLSPSPRKSSGWAGGHGRRRRGADISGGFGPGPSCRVVRTRARSLRPRAAPPGARATNTSIGRRTHVNRPDAANGPSCGPSCARGCNTPPTRIASISSPIRALEPYAARSAPSIVAACASSGDWFRRACVGASNTRTVGPLVHRQVKIKNWRVGGRAGSRPGPQHGVLRSANRDHSAPHAAPHPHDRPAAPIPDDAAGAGRLDAGTVRL